MLLAAGCVGDPDLESAGSDLRTVTLERDVWEHAFPGCEEDVERAGALLHLAAGEPLLGVLVSRRGRVLCVDSLSLLTQETREDPTPTPAIPAGGRVHDPTSTPASDD